MISPEILTLISVIAAVVSTICAAISINKVTQHKALDLRLQLRTEIDSFKQSLNKVVDLMLNVDRSRQRVFAATGKRNSGEAQIWTSSMETDLAWARESLESDQFEIADYNQLGLKQLEVKLAEVRKVQTEIDELIEKYQAELAKDDRERDRIQDRHN